MVTMVLQVCVHVCMCAHVRLCLSVYGCVSHFCQVFMLPFHIDVTDQIQKCESDTPPPTHTYILRHTQRQTDNCV